MYLVVCDWKNEYIHAEVSQTSEIASIKLQCELDSIYSILVLSAAAAVLRLFACDCSTHLHFRSSSASSSI